MSSRVIRSHGGSRILIDCLSSLLALEAVSPSEEIYIISPWISNSPIIDNRYNAFVDVFPFIESKIVYLADILKTFLWRGSKVRLICNPGHKQTKEFLDMLGSRAKYRNLTDNHEKDMITDNFYLHGSMNFTFSGININGECIRVTTKRADISSAVISARSRWEESQT